MPFPNFRSIAGGIKKAATTPIRMPGRRPAMNAAPRPAMSAPASPIGAGARYAGGMTSGKNVKTYSTLGQARAAGTQRPGANKFMQGQRVTKRRSSAGGGMPAPQASPQPQNKFLSGQRQTRRRSSAGFSNFARLINFAINN